MYFGDVVVVLLDGLWIACALLVGDGLAGRRGGRWRSAWCFAMPLHARFYMDDRTRYEGTKVPSYLRSKVDNNKSRYVILAEHLLIILSNEGR